MDLKDLKNTWDKMSSGKELDEGQLRGMLGKRTKSLMDKIDRNIKIGFIVLFALIIVFALDDFFLSPLMLDKLDGELTIPKWLIFLGVFSNVLIFTTFIYFVIKYTLVKRNCDIICDLKETLSKIIDTLKIYQRMFYLALFSLLFAMASAFITGLYEGFTSGIEQQGYELADVESNKLVLVVLIGIAVLTAFVGGLFLFLRWGFRRLYGNYILELKQTLNELNEIE